MYRWRRRIPSVHRREDVKGKIYSAKIEVALHYLGNLCEQYGDIDHAFRAATDYGYAALTEFQARYRAGIKPADAVRDRILAGRESARRVDDPDDAGPARPTQFSLAGLIDVLARGCRPAADW